MNHYPDINLHNGIISARNEAYRILSGKTITQSTYREVRIINGSLIPFLTDLLWVDQATYIGVTVDRSLFSFSTCQTTTFESGIISAYVVKSEVRQLMILLEDGSLRMINIDNNSDYQVLDQVAHMCPLYNELTAFRYGLSLNINQSNYWLVITSDNRYLILSSEDTEFKIIHQIKNVWKIDHRDIIMVRNGAILANNGWIAMVRGCRAGTVTSYNLNYYNNYLNITEWIDILPRSDRCNGETIIIGLRKNGQFYEIKDSLNNQFSDNRIDIIKPIRLLTHYEAPGRMNVNYVYTQGIKGDVYRVEIKDLSIDCY